MSQNDPTEPPGEGHPLDPGIRAAFGGNAKARPSSRPSVLETVTGQRRVRRILLRDVEEEGWTHVRSSGDGAAEYPDQIDRYHVAGEIARGGVGVVLRARDLDLGRQVALKVLLDRHRGNSELNMRFLEEAQIGGQLEHPGIVPVYEIGVYDRDRPYLAMKYVRGQTLAELLESRESAEEERQRFVGIFEQVCQTLAYAHSKGVIHRDLKPSNVMVGPFGEVQIMDWGLAKVLTKGGPAEDAKTTKDVGEPDRSASGGRDGTTGSDSLAGSVMGTPAYMAPEQANGDVESLDERSDVFGLGALLCEILTGRPPYTGNASDEVFRKAKAADLGDALQRLEACTADAELLQAARSCLRPDPRERPRNAIVVAKKVRSYLESLEARARALEMRAGKARLKLAVAVVAIVGLLAGSTGFFLYQGERRQQAGLVEAAVAEGKQLVERARASQDLETWQAALREANRALELARGNVDSSDVDRLTGWRDAIAADVKDQRALARLERLRQDRGWDAEELSRAIQEVFAPYGIDIDTTSVARAAEIIRDSSISSSLVQALDQWTLIQRGPLRRKLFAIAQAADADTWRSRVRSALMERDEAALARLADEAADRELDPSTFELIASSLQRPARRPGHDMPHAERIERVWRHAQEVHPGDFWINAQLGKFLRYREDHDEALQYTRIAVALRPGNGYVRYQLGAVLEETGKTVEAFQQMTKAVLLDPGFGRAFRKLSELLEHDDGLPPAEIEALLHGLERVVDSGEPFHLAGLTRLQARAQAALGRTAQAISTLEAARRNGALEDGGGHPFGRRDRAAGDLDEYRRRLRPDLASYASIDAALDGELAGIDAGEAIARFRKLHEGSDAARPRLAYLEARELQREGRLEEAAARLREVVTADSTLPEPFVHLARCLRETGRSQEAERILRQGLGVETVRCPEAWKLWTEIAFVDLGRDARGLLQDFPGDDSVGPGLPRPRPGYGEDLRWLLGRLAAGEPVRINCGGEAYRATEGPAWSRDRFYSEGSRSYFGRVFFGEISGTEDDALYQTERWFPRNAAQPQGYSVPLPPGTYTVDLHFAEIWHRDRENERAERVFDLRVEGETVLERYAPGRKGFAVADRFEVEVEVDDGALDIVPSHRRGNPKISAISVKEKT